MPETPRSERRTQNRVVALFTDTVRQDCLGYRYLCEPVAPPREIEQYLLFCGDAANPNALNETEALRI